MKYLGQFRETDRAIIRVIGYKEWKKVDQVSLSHNGWICGCIIYKDKLLLQIRPTPEAVRQGAKNYNVLAYKGLPVISGKIAHALKRTLGGIEIYKKL